MAMWSLYRNAKALDAVVAFVGGMRPSSVWVHPSIQVPRTRQLSLLSRYLQVRVPLRVLPSKFKQNDKRLEFFASCPTKTYLDFYFDNVVRVVEANGTVYNRTATV